MSNAKDCPSLPNRGFHPETVLQTCGHGFLTKNVVSLISKCQSDLEMHMILHSNDDRVGETFTNGVDGLRRGCVQIFPCCKDEGLVYLMMFCKEFLSFQTWFCNSDNFTTFWTLERVFGICLQK